MIEIFKIKRNLALITVEGLRDKIKEGIDYTYEFKLIGFTNQKMPQYVMFIYIGNSEHILTAIKNTQSTGPTVRILNLFSAVITLHQEFGLGIPLSVETTADKIYKFPE